MANKYPRLGTGIVILNEKDQILLGKRLKKPVGFQIPGGHVEFGETLIENAKRETMEEVGIEITDVEAMTFAENLFLDQDYHSLSIFLFAMIKKGEILGNPEPDKCAGWDWFDLENFPTNLAFNYDPLIKNGKEFIYAYKQKILKKSV